MPTLTRLDADRIVCKTIIEEGSASARCWRQSGTLLTVDGAVRTDAGPGLLW